MTNEDRSFVNLNPPRPKALEQGPSLPPSLTHRPRHLPAQANPSLTHEDHRAGRLRSRPLGDER
ncbi:hypothetical protein ABZT06_07525 [Streptomyces sp. NPDC005483]|uniref:hypothetical protein n=1 Tax=Streptomyces sp. NPDC005483 TaxID=3154882 RepID=UPI0033B15797